MRSKPSRSNLEERERAAARHRKFNEVRHWNLVCPACDHEGTVLTTLARLKAANIKCSVCGTCLWRNGT